MVAPTVDYVAIDINIRLPFKNFFVLHVLSCDDVTTLNNTHLPAKLVILGILHVSTTRRAICESFKSLSTSKTLNEHQKRF